MEDIEQRVAEMLAEITGSRPDTFRPDTVLDLESEDAAELFQRLAGEFSVDLHTLNEHWSEHFAERGSPPGCGLAILLGIVAGWPLHARFPIVPVWLAIAASMAIVLTGYLGYAWFFMAKRTYAAITVQDLVDAVRAGRWVKTYSITTPRG